MLRRPAQRTFLRRSGFPFFTVARTMSPGPALGSRLRRAPKPTTAMMYRFLAPVLSAQFITDRVCRPHAMRNFLPRTSSFSFPMVLPAGHPTEASVSARAAQSGPGAGSRGRQERASCGIPEHRAHPPPLTSVCRDGGAWLGRGSRVPGVAGEAAVARLRDEGPPE